VACPVFYYCPLKKHSMREKMQFYKKGSKKDKKGPKKQEKA
jgi:hypothetical protein